MPVRHEDIINKGIVLNLHYITYNQRILHQYKYFNQTTMNRNNLNKCKVPKYSIRT
jgi:hypothetical protein